MDLKGRRVQRETSEFPVPAGLTDPRERRDHEVLPEVMDLTGQRDFGDPLDPPDPLVMPQRASSTAEEGTLTISRRSKSNSYMLSSRLWRRT